jgi:hypothetical protein
VLTLRRLLAVVPLLLAASLAAVVLGSSARASSCRVMTVDYGVTGRSLVVLDPDHYDIAYGGCVQFVNQTAATATITVGSHYAQQLAPNANTAGPTNFHGTTPGRLLVTATSGPASGSAHGSITVSAAPPGSPSPRPPAPSRTATPPPPASPPASTGSGPQVAPTPSRSRPPGQRRGGLQPPVSPPGPVQTQSSPPTPTPAATAVVSGPVEPASGRGGGLPTALAALAVVGSGAAFIRVLAAEPVDDAQTVGGRP